MTTSELLTKLEVQLRPENLLQSVLSAISSMPNYKQEKVLADLTGDTDLREGSLLVTLARDKETYEMLLRALESQATHDDVLNSTLAKLSITTAPDDEAIPNNANKEEARPEYGTYAKKKTGTSQASALGPLPSIHSNGGARGGMKKQLPRRNRKSNRDKGNNKGKKTADAERKEKAGSDVPSELVCAINGHIVKEPVKSIYGHTFEKETIKLWLSNNGSVCPISGMEA